LVKQLDDILSQLLNAAGKDVSKIIDQLIQVLNIPNGVDLVGFLQQLIDSLEQFLQQVLEAVSKLLDQLLGNLTQLDLLNGILSDLKVVSIVAKLIDTLKQILNVVKGLNL
jgi:phage-related protein